MASVKPILATILVLGIGYVAYPYVTLYRLGHAVQSGDAATLRHLVNWPAVREGIKEDICDNPADPPAQTVSATLPPFGASFMRGIATNVVDQRVTPQGFVAFSRHEASASQSRLHVSWAFFRSPTEFVADLGAPGQLHPIRLQLTLHDGTWRLNRIWLPQRLLHEANGAS